MVLVADTRCVLLRFVVVGDDVGVAAETLGRAVREALD